MGVAVGLAARLRQGYLAVRELGRPSDAPGGGATLIYTDRVSGKLRAYSARRGDRTLEPAAGGGSGDVVGPSSSVASEVALFDGTTGKLLKRAAITGIAKLASGVLSAATAGTDYYAPGSTDVAVADGGTGASSAAGARTNLGGSPSRSASGFLELDAQGFFGLDAVLAGWRHSVALANFAGGVASYFGMGNPSQGGTAATASSAGWTRKESNSANSNFHQGTRLIRRSFGFSVALSFKLPTAVTSRRFWVGLTSADMTNSDTASGHFVGARYSTVAGDAGFMPVSRDGTTQTVGSAGSAPVADVPYLFVATGAPSGSSVAVKIIRLDTGATVLDATISANLPDSGTAIDWVAYTYAQGTTRATEIGHVTRVMGLT